MFNKILWWLTGQKWYAYLYFHCYEKHTTKYKNEVVRLQQGIRRHAKIKKEKTAEEER